MAGCVMVNVLKNVISSEHEEQRAIGRFDHQKF